VVSVGGGLQRDERLRGQSHPFVELGEWGVGLEAVGQQVQDLLEDRDRAGIEALFQVLLGDALIGLDRLVDLTPTPMCVTDLEP
jgi:hypothetical protein